MESYNQKFVLRPAQTLWWQVLQEDTGGVENTLHWRLDVVLRQDDSRYRDRIGARNLAVVRKIALNAVSKETSIKGGIATRQYAASFNPAYRDKILKNLF